MKEKKEENKKIRDYHDFLERKDIYEYDYDGDDLAFLVELLLALDRNAEIDLTICDKDYFIGFDEKGNRCIYFKGEAVLRFDLLESFLTKFIIDGKPFIEQLGNITGWGFTG